MIDSVGEMARERLELRMWTTLKKVSSSSIQADKCKHLHSDHKQHETEL